ncbi:MAG: hypothetical protein JW819_06260 [Candidatus Krumholzibacteriota bacterium]|nr:hypothetical protein [Candidatus Krumholzibacteriota bacterium]
MRARLAAAASILLAAIPAAGPLAATVHVPGGQPTIQAGLDAAAAGDTVLVAADTYQEHGLIMAAAVVLRGATGDPADVVIDAEQMDEVLNVASVAGTVRIEALTLTRGVTDGSGGGLNVDASAVELTDCVVSACMAADGGGVYLSGSTATLLRCAVEDNAASSQGGGLAAFSGATAQLVDCEVRGNSAYEGGGLFASEDSDLDCEAVTVADNEAIMCGGGVYTTGGDASLLQCDFMGNTCATSRGGGVYVYSSLVDCYPEINGCLFLGNGANQGGAFAATHMVDATLTNCTLVENVSNLGAGIYCAFGAHTGIVNCVVAFNTMGAAAYCGEWGDTGTIDAACSDVFGNELGDWVDCLAGGLSEISNFSEDPELCGITGSGNCLLQSDSFCAPGNHPNGVACGLIGARDVGCDETAARAATWSAVKARY